MHSADARLFARSLLNWSRCVNVSRDILAELEWRGLIHQTTDGAPLRDWLAARAV